MTPPIVICEPLRTPIGKLGGSLANVQSQELGATVVRELVRRCGLEADQVDDLILGNCNPTGAAPAIGRVVALDAGLSTKVPGAQVDRRCGSGLQAIANAAMQVAFGVSRLVIAGGVESMSNAPFVGTGLRGKRMPTSFRFDDNLELGRVSAGGRNHPVPGGMIETAENLRREYDISREEQDELAYESHRRALAAQSEGRFDDEIVAVEVGGKTVTVDEHPRADISIEALRKLRPVRGAADSSATVTPGNSSGQNDGAAACIVTSEDHAQRLNLRPLVRLVAWSVVGVEPHRMGIGPVEATHRVLDQAGLKLDDIGLIELNEAFAAQALACYRELGLGREDLVRVNVNGSGISLGHPVGATGGRVLATLSREMDRTGTRYGLETMCIGGGQGIAALFERC